MKINENYLNLKDTYLFKTIAQKTAAYRSAHPDCDIIPMGIGDVTRPLCPSVISEMGQAVKDMGRRETFHGYPDSFGEDFLLSAIQAHYAEHLGVHIETEEIVVTSGAKEDIANILDIFSDDNTVLIPDPVYPVYYDTNIMTGRKIKFIKASAENAFLPLPTEADAADIIYLCSPNNPTGSAYTRTQLEVWVDFALRHRSVILFDAAYEMFITDENCPRSIFEIEKARQCAIEFCSFSKTAGFTGVRCGYTVVPKELTCGGVRLLELWKRRQSTKFNGVSYVVQRGAAAVFSKIGYREVLENIAYYKVNTQNMMATFSQLGWTYYGGENGPYIWLKCPDAMKSWDFFDLLLTKCNVIGTPGAGFGQNGEGYFRLSGFGEHERTKTALKRIKKEWAT